MFTSQRNSPRQQLVTQIILPDTPSPKRKQSLIQPVSPLRKSKEIVLPVTDSIKNNLDHSNSQNYEQYLTDQLANSQKLVPFVVKQLINQQMASVQTRVHDIQSGQDKNLALNNVYKNSVSQNIFIQNGIRDVVNQVGTKVANNIRQKMRPQRIIPKTKDDIKELQKVDKYRYLKIKNGQIKNKIGDLRSELEQQYFQRKAKYQVQLFREDLKNSDYYSLENPRTQQANQFINKIKKQRQQEKYKYFQYLQNKKEQYRAKSQQEQQRKQTEAQQRRKRLQQRFKQKQLKKLAEEEQSIKKREDYKAWSNLFNKQKPLYIKKQQQFIEKNLIPQIYQRRDRLLQIKMQHKPIDIQQLNNHDERYMQYKRDNQIRAEAQIELQRQKLQAYSQDLKHLYKGKYRYVALQEMMNRKLKNSEDPKQLQREKKARQIVYADQIKDKLHQEIKLKQKTLDTEKKQFTKRTRNMDGSVASIDDQAKMSSFTDPKSQGKKNMHFLKQLIKQKGIKQKKPLIKFLGEKNAYPDYLHEVHTQRKSANLNMSLNLEQQSQVSQLNSLMAKQKFANQKANRGYVRRKYNSLDYKEDVSIQENQIQAAKLKMKLISQLN